MKKMTVQLSATCLAVSLIMTGCSKNNSGEEGANRKSVIPVADAKPVELTLMPIVQMTDVEFQQMVFEPVKKKYQNITVKLVRLEKGKTLDDLVVSGEVPDIFYAAHSYVSEKLAQLDLVADLRPMIKKNKVDLSVVDPKALEAIQGTGGEIYGIPQLINSYAMLYRKDIFDKFAVPYPKDGMSWDDMYELGKRLTRSVDGTNYRGLDANDVIRLGNPYSMPYVDPKTNKSIISEKWQEIFMLAKKIQDIPGNKSPGPNFWAQPDVINPAKTLAMAPIYSNVLTQVVDQEKNGLEWDLVQYPSFKDLPNRTVQFIVHEYFVSKTSKEKDAAVLAMGATLSEEVQSVLARKGKIPVLKNEQIKKQFADEYISTKNKNVQAFFKSEMAKPAPVHQYDQIVIKAIMNAFAEVFNDKIDVNTALTKAKELADKDIAAQGK